MPFYLSASVFSFSPSSGGRGAAPFSHVFFSFGGPRGNVPGFFSWPALPKKKKKKKKCHRPPPNPPPPHNKKKKKKNPPPPPQPPPLRWMVSELGNPFFPFFPPTPPHKIFGVSSSSFPLLPLDLLAQLSLSPPFPPRGFFFFSPGFLERRNPNVSFFLFFFFFPIGDGWTPFSVPAVVGKGLSLFHLRRRRAFFLSLLAVLSPRQRLFLAIPFFLFLRNALPPFSPPPFDRHPALLFSFPNPLAAIIDPPLPRSSRA